MGTGAVTSDAHDHLSQSELERLAILHTYEVVDAKGTATLDNALAITAHVAGARAAFMAMVDLDQLVFKATHGFGNPSQSIARGGSFCDWVIRNDGRPLIVADARSDQRFIDHPQVRRGLRFFAGFPVVAGNTHVVGVLAALDCRPIHPTTAQSPDRHAGADRREHDGGVRAAANSVSRAPHGTHRHLDRHRQPARLL